MQFFLVKPWELSWSISILAKRQELAWNVKKYGPECRKVLKPYVIQVQVFLCNSLLSCFPSLTLSHFLALHDSINLFFRISICLRINCIIHLKSPDRVISGRRRAFYRRAIFEFKSHIMESVHALNLNGIDCWCNFNIKICSLTVIKCNVTEALQDPEIICSSLHWNHICGKYGQKIEILCKCASCDST
jgi:hypothetical protein